MSEGSLTDSLRNGADQTQMRFIDLFAGLGGFHLALKNLGHRSVFASEIDESLRATYYENFGVTRATISSARGFHVSRSPRLETTQSRETQSSVSYTCGCHAEQRS